MKALITGGTGLLGGALCAHVADPVVLSRDPTKATGVSRAARVVRWEPSTEPAPASALEGVDAVFHLAGESVASGRWTAAKKACIVRSRVEGTRRLVAGLRALERRPEVFVCASAVGYYGDRGDEELDETSPVGAGFLAEVCAAWEREALAAEALGVRVVCVRMGIVLSAGSGALARMLPPFKMGAGGRLGSGEQWMPWIHVDDAVQLLLHAGHVSSIRGPMNAVSPRPVTNAEFTRTLARAVRRPAVVPVPKAALRLAFGEMSAIMTASQRVLPSVALRSGFSFRYPELGAALAALLGALQPTAA